MKDRYTDPLDAASELETAEREAQINAARLKPDLAFVEGENEYECSECGEIIPTARRKATGSLLCVDCKSYFDRLKIGGKFRGDN